MMDEVSKTTRRNAATGGTARLFAASMLGASLLLAGPAFSQSFESQDASESIADSEISVEDTSAADRADDLLQSIADLPQSIDRVKIITTMEKIDVVYLSDLIGANPPREIKDAIEASDERIRELQKGLEASAIFYNALTSRDVNIPDVVTITLDEPNATIFVRGVAPDQALSLEEVEGRTDEPDTAGEAEEAPAATGAEEAVPEEAAPADQTTPEEIDDDAADEGGTAPAQ